MFRLLDKNYKHTLHFSRKKFKINITTTKKCILKIEKMKRYTVNRMGEQ